MPRTSPTLLEELEGKTTTDVETACRALGIGRSLGYQLAAAGELPGVLRLGRRFVVGVPALLKALGVEDRGADPEREIE